LTAVGRVVNFGIMKLHLPRLEWRCSISSSAATWRLAILLLLAGGALTGCQSSRPAEKPPVVSGVGLYLVRDQASGEFILRRTFPNSPAAKANLPLNTILYRVNGVFVQPLHISKVSELVQGPEGTKVFLEFVDPATRVMHQATITRAKFANESR
jgi:hypothetical protein